VTTLHQPTARTWLCAVCWLPWPCESRRRQLLAHYEGEPASLAMILGAAMIEAAADLRDRPAGELHDQFIGWLSRHQVG
jgi:hypothetical protein